MFYPMINKDSHRDDVTKITIHTEAGWDLVLKIQNQKILVTILHCVYASNVPIYSKP